MRPSLRPALLILIVALLALAGPVANGLAAPAAPTSTLGQATNGENGNGDDDEKDPCKKKDAPCSEIPEAPVALLYAGVGAVALGGFFLLNRRRQSRAQIPA